MIISKNPHNYSIYIDKLTCLLQGKSTVLSNCVFELKPKVLQENGCLWTLYAAIEQEDDSVVYGEYNVGFLGDKLEHNMDFKVINQKDAASFQQAPPFEHLDDLENITNKQSRESLRTIIAASKIYKKPDTFADTKVGISAALGTTPPSSSSAFIVQRQ